MKKYAGRILLSLVVFYSASMPSSVGYAQSMAVMGSDNCEKSSTPEYVRRFRESLIRVVDGVKTEQETISELGGVASISLADADRALDSSRDDLLSMAYQRATTPLELVIKELFLLAPSQERCEKLRDAYSKLAWAYKKQGKDKECAAGMRRMTNIGAFDLDSDLFPPSFHKYVEKLSKDAQKQTNPYLNINTNPAGLTIHINGCPVGAAPMKFSLPPGEYLVEAAFLTGRGFPKKIVVQNHDITVELDQSFDGAIRAARGPCFHFSGNSQDRLTKMALLSSVLKVESMVTLRENEVIQDGTYLVASILEKNKDIREARIKLSPGGQTNADIEKLASFIVSGKAVPPVEELDAQTSLVKKPSAENPSQVSYPWKRTAAWSLVGVAVALGVFTVVEQVRLNELEAKMAASLPQEGETLEKQKRSDYTRWRDQSKTVAAWRTVGAIGAGAAALGSGTMFWLSYRPSSSINNQSNEPKISLVISGEF